MIFEDEQQLFYQESTVSARGLKPILSASEETCNFLAALAFSESRDCQFLFRSKIKTVEKG